VPAATGRKARPAALKIVGGRGNGRDSGGRVVAPAPPFEREVPAKPDDLTPKAAEMWDAIVATLPKMNLLKPLDGFALEVGCETFARWHAAKTARVKAGANSGADGVLSKTSQGVGVSPLVRVESEASREFRAWCSEFGLTPAAEAKLSADVAASGNGDLF